MDIHIIHNLTAEQASSNQCSSELVSSNSIKIKSSFGRVNKHFLPIYFLTISCMPRMLKIDSNPTIKIIS